MSTALTKRFKSLCRSCDTKDQMSALNNIASSVRNLVLYNSRVNAAYQKKSLELQYQKHYPQADMLKEAKQVSADTVSSPDAIAITGLFDYF